MTIRYAMPKRYYTLHNGRKGFKYAITTGIPSNGIIVPKLKISRILKIAKLQYILSPASM